MWQILLATTFIYSANESTGPNIEEQAVLLHYFGTKIPFAGVNFTYGAYSLLYLHLVWHTR